MQPPWVVESGSDSVMEGDFSDQERAAVGSPAGVSPAQGPESSPVGQSVLLVDFRQL